MSRVISARGSTRRDQQGQSLPLVAIMMTSLIMLTGIAFDIGLAVIEAYKIQRASDAGAIAAVVYMPGDFTAATTAARAVTQQNGYTHGQNGVNVSVATVSGFQQRIRVTIDAPGRAQLLSILGFSLFNIDRHAIGEYVLPLDLGSPQNQFGYRPTQTFWAGINSRSVPKYQGDAFMAQTTNGTTPNPEFDPGGYNYAISVPGTCERLAVSLYDAGFYRRSSLSVETGDIFYTSGTILPTTYYTLYRPDATPLVLSDDVPQPPVSGGSSYSVTGCNSTGCTAAGKNAWVLRWDITSPLTPTYRLNVNIIGGSQAYNGYAIKAECIPAGGGAPVGTQPTVAGSGRMSMYSNLNAGNTEFYLANVAAEHAGKTMVVRLWDPGDAAGLSSSNPARIWILDPSGAIYNNVTWLYENGSTASIVSNEWGQHNGQWVQGIVVLPSPYSGGWWRIRFYYPFQATDRTTWAVGLRGNPVHLVE